MDSKLPDLSGASILLLDDHSGQSSSLVRFLSARNAKQVVTVRSTEQAFHKIGTESFDVVLVDLLMPDLDAMSFLKSLHQEDRYCNLPVIVISSIDDDRRTINCLAAGAEDYLAKPVDYALMATKIHGCLKRRSTQTNQLRQAFSTTIAAKLHEQIKAGQDITTAPVLRTTGRCRYFSSVL